VELKEFERITSQFKVIDMCRKRSGCSLRRKKLPILSIDFTMFCLIVKNNFNR